MKHFAIAGLQLAVSDQDNRFLIQSHVERIKRVFPWVQMVVVGELASFGTGLACAEQLPGNSETLYRELARALDIWLLPGSLYEKHGDHVYNTALVINPQGDVVLRYRKQFPFRPYEKGVSPGAEFGVFDVPGVGRFGLSICYDQWFPETTRQLAWLGAEVVICPTMTNTIDRELELCIARANAVMNQCYFFNINVAGALGNGRSIVVGPEGNVVHQAGAGTEVIPVEVDTALVKRVRERGTLGLGQVLKSFRDSALDFPAYDLARRRSAPLEDLGELSMPDRDQRDQD
ncbi:MAG: carbon-nitrogen hydrolase family protein [Halieaceae bacterium]|nr:carbon-nitrogen hydrolase family protein [Halieaceae bacterium]MCP5148515.1 carbon-nitrogen hydrolase family protein [Pseudomonadales bacterium]